MIVVRWAISMGIAAGVTLSLFFFMSVLIATGETLSERVSVVKIVDATMPDIELEVIEEIDKLLILRVCPLISILAYNSATHLFPLRMVIICRWLQLLPSILPGLHREELKAGA